MKTLYAYDGASAFSLTDAKVHGAILITGYIVGHPGGFDPINRNRVRQIHALGMGFLPNWERGASYLATATHAEGVAAGKEAVAALRALGVPDDGTVACAFSWDSNVPPERYAKCGVVADGIIAGLAGHYLFTAYGQGGLIDYLANTGRLESEGWLSASSSFPGYDAANPRVALVQRVGSPVDGTDQNIVTDPANVHAWWPPGSRYAGGDQVSASDVIAALKSPEGQQLLQEAMLSAKVDLADPAKDATFGQILRAWHGWLSNDQALLVAAADRKALAKAIAAALPAGAGGLNSDQLVAAVEAGVRAVFADAAAP